MLKTDIKYWHFLFPKQTALLVPNPKLAALKSKVNSSYNYTGFYNIHVYNAPNCPKFLTPNEKIDLHK